MATSRCRLLTLPAELRNEIYELAFTDNDQNPVDLCRAKPPRRSLLLACRQTYREASQIYKAAYRKYWSTRVFVMDFNDTETIDATHTRLLNQYPQDLQNIRSLSMKTAKSTPFGRLSIKATLLDERGMWLREELDMFQTTTDYMII